MKLLLSLFGILLLLCISKKLVAAVGPKGGGFNYKVSVPDEYILKPCEQHPDNFIDKMFDLSNVTFTYDDNENLVIKGSTKYIGDIVFDKTTEISADLQAFKKQRGEWVSTVYNFYRANLCDSVWNPAELWYKFTENVPQESRTCPPDIGSVYNLDFVADLTIKNSPDRNAAGDYKTQGTIKYGSSPDDLICFTVLGYIEKI